MLKYLCVLGFVFALTACQTNTVAPYYSESRFNVADGGTRLSFDEAMSVCRSKTLEHHWMGDTEDLNVPNYKACMESYGFRFGKTE